jgi:hypothetical protein
MPERIAGKTFLSPEEARAAGRPVLSDAERADAIAQFEQWDRDVRQPAAHEPPVAIGGKFSDDLAGTEYESEMPDPSVYDRIKRGKGKQGH